MSDPVSPTQGETNDGSTTQNTTSEDNKLTFSKLSHALLTGERPEHPCKDNYWPESYRVYVKK